MLIFYITRGGYMLLSFVTIIKSHCKRLNERSAFHGRYYKSQYIVRSKLKYHAFSLVEMLMALLVASLLLAALAPVMTRRMADHEIKVLSEASNYDKDMVVSIITEDTKFNIPQDANQIRMTLMGGGGSGGNAFYGNKVFTNSGTFTVPEGVTKLRVFMVGGGGGGASGGGSGTAYGNIGGTAGTQEYAGSSAANTGVKTWNIPSSARGNVPPLDSRCAKNGITVWKLVSDKTKTVQAGGTVVNVKACGGGGGGGGGSSDTSLANSYGGGSGGYVNKQVAIPSSFSSVSVTIGGGGGGGSGDDSLRGKGANGAGWGGGGGGTEFENSYTSSGYAPGGNGGYGMINCVKNNVTYVDSAPFILAKNGTGTYSKTVKGVVYTAGKSNCENTTTCSQNGTGGGSGSLEGGGGGGGSTTSVNSGGGGGATFFGRYTHSGIYDEKTTNDASFFLVAAGGGGGGLSGGGGGGIGGGFGGNGAAPATGGNSGKAWSGATGGAGGASPMGNSYCAGGKGGNADRYVGSNGQNGYMLISWASQANALECSYDITSNGGGGGGAGQITVNEITVTPNETLYFEVGGGGVKQTSIASNGNAGNASHIRRGSSITSPAIISASGGYGGEFSSSETSPSQGAPSRNPNIGTNWTGIDYKAKISLAQGHDGYLETNSSSSGYGGSGGSSQNIKGETLSGGIGGNSIKNGGEPDITSYGAGGGGGSGGLADNEEFGTGGAGASGFIYIEWGGANGGGGTAGEIVKKVITNFEGDASKRVMDIKIGRGGSNGDGGITSASVIAGGKTVTYEAKGGIKGYDGTMDIQKHGAQTDIPDNFSNEYKEYVQSNLTIAAGQKGTDEYGGMGGYLACLFYTKDEEGNSVCAAAVKSNDGLNASLGPIRPGCGGTSILSPLYDSICNITNTNASPQGNNGTFGGGGGGGAVLNNTGGKGGNGGDGFVILEYKSTTLE